MSVKTIYSLHSALLLSNSIISEGLIDANKIVSENQQKNSKILDKNKAFLDRNWKVNYKKKEELILPVNLAVFDQYYKRLSEWKYWDKYHYDSNVLVFNKDEYDWKKERERKKYQDKWLNNLFHLRSYRYFDSNHSQYPSKDDSMHISWIDGGGSSLQLRNLLNLNLPQKITDSFEMHEKIVELELSFPMKSIIPIFSGYWKKGELNKKNNVIKSVKYGNLKLDYVRWSDIYHFNLGKHKHCDQLAQSEDHEFKERGREVFAGFDSQCDRINLLDFWSFFWTHRNRKIFSSGYVGYKYKYPASWNKHYYFYSLGDWSLDRPSKFQVNRENGEKNLWFVSYDNLFLPEIKLVDPKAGESNIGKTFQLSFYLNHQKIKNIDAFIKIASALNYRLKFRYDAKAYEVDFSLRDVLSSTKFNLGEKIGNVKLQNAAFSNFELIVYSKNPDIKLSASDGSKEFKYKVNLAIIERGFNLIHSLLIDQEELKNFYYSELKEQEKIKKLFYLIKQAPEKLERNLENISEEWAKLLNFEIVGSDASSVATIQYYDFLADETKKIEIFNLLSLPNFEEEKYYRKDAFTLAEELISKQTKKKIGEYFWKTMELELEEKDVLNGKEIYTLKKKKNDSNTPDWQNHFKGVKVEVRDEFHRYLLPQQGGFTFPKDAQKKDYSSLFSISNHRDRDIELKLSDFAFRLINENEYYLELEVEYKPYRERKSLQFGKKKYDNVKLSGKTTFKLNKKDNSFTSPSLNFSRENYLASSPINSASNSWNKGDSILNMKGFMPVVLSSILGGGGAAVGTGILLFKKFRLAST